MIRHYRKALGLSQTELAERVGITTPHLSRMERGERTVTEHWLRRIADALGTTPGALLAAKPGFTEPAPATFDASSFEAMRERLAQTSEAVESMLRD